MKKVLFFFLITVLLCQVFAEALTLNEASDSLASNDEANDGVALYKKYHHKNINCSYACARRCSKTSRKKVCTRACKSCCARCYCVPPGTYGNKEVCPCYANLKTHGNKPKCP